MIKIAGIGTALAVLFATPALAAREVPKPAPLEVMVENRVEKVFNRTDEITALKLFPTIKREARRVRAEWVESYENYQDRVEREAAEAAEAAADEVLIEPESAPSGAAYDTDSSGVSWDAIANCESGGNWSINTGNGYYGGLQFSYSTWHAYGGGQYAEYPHQTSRENQIAVASGMSLSHWPHCGAYG